MTGTLPGNSLIPIESVRYVRVIKVYSLTAIQSNVFFDNLGIGARLSISSRLHLQSSAIGIGTTGSFKSIHALLESVVLPAKQIVAMLAVSGALTRVSGVL